MDFLSEDEHCLGFLLHKSLLPGFLHEHSLKSHFPPLDMEMNHVCSIIFQGTIIKME